MALLMYTNHYELVPVRQEDATNHVTDDVRPATGAWGCSGLNAFKTGT